MDETMSLCSVIALIACAVFYWSLVGKGKNKGRRSKDWRCDNPKKPKGSAAKRISYEGFTGTRAEWRLYLALTDGSIQGHMAVYHNVLIPQVDGGLDYTEIDLIAVHEKGIYVIESKDYSGWIFASRSSENWCQTFENGEKHFFYNPIKQNEGHIAALLRYLEVDRARIRSFVVFGETAEFKERPEDEDDYVLCSEWDLPDKLLADIEGRWACFGERGFEQVVRALDKAQENSTAEALKAHAEAVAAVAKRLGK